MKERRRVPRIPVLSHLQTHIDHISEQADNLTRLVEELAAAYKDEEANEPGKPR